MIGIQLPFSFPAGSRCSINRITLEIYRRWDGGFAQGLPWRELQWPDSLSTLCLPSLWLIQLPYTHITFVPHTCAWLRCTRAKWESHWAGLLRTAWFGIRIFLEWYLANYWRVLPEASFQEETSAVQALSVCFRVDLLPWSLFRNRPVQHTVSEVSSELPPHLVSKASPTLEGRDDAERSFNWIRKLFMKSAEGSLQFRSAKSRAGRPSWVVFLLDLLHLVVQ